MNTEKNSVFIAIIIPNRRLKNSDVITIELITEWDWQSTKTLLFTVLNTLCFIPHYVGNSPLKLNMYKF